MGKKTDRLDNAFLFALGSLGLLISFIQIRPEELSGLIEAIPFLLLGVLLPFWVGYLRGAIEMDSLGERLRGWIYLLVGTMSYFASFLSSRVMNSYPQYTLLFPEIVLVVVLALSLFFVLLLVKWAQRVFRRSINSYAISGTVISAFAVAFSLTLVVGLYRDSSIIGLPNILSTASQLLFFVSITLASFLIALILGKASADALERTLPMPTTRGRARRFFNLAPVKGILLGTMLLEYAFDFNSGARLVWLLSYVLWCLGSLLWFAGVAFIPTLLYILTIFFASVGVVMFVKTGAIDFQRLETRGPFKLFYCLMVFVLVFLLLFTNGFFLNIAVSFVLITLLFVLLRILPPNHF